MRRRAKKSHRGTKHRPGGSGASHDDPLRSAGSRKFLRHLDRELQRFSARVAAMEDRAGRAEISDGGDLMVAVELLHRETLLLRAEIQEFLASGNRGADEMIDQVEDSWEQLRESFDEIRESLMLESTFFSATPPPEDGEEDDEGSFDESSPWDSEYSHLDFEAEEQLDIHPPRLGPKR